MYCVRCGSKNAAGTRFCYKCGKRLEPETTGRTRADSRSNKPAQPSAAQRSNQIDYSGPQTKKSNGTGKSIGRTVIKVVVAFIIMFVVLEVIYYLIGVQSSQFNYTTSSPYYSTTNPYYTTTNNYYTTANYTPGNYGCSPLPCSYIKNGYFTFLFTLVNGSVWRWYFPVTEYNEWVSTPRIDAIIRLNDTLTGRTIYTWDYRSTVTPNFFANVTPALTKGRTAAQFVAEVQNINSQLVNYSLVFYNTSIYPAQLLGQGQGDCKDKGVLMASILEAGNIEANYGMNIQFVYVDAGNLTAPRVVNHLMLYVTYSNGTSVFLDTTHVLETTPYFSGRVVGWYYNLTCTMAGCLSTPICTGSYCDAVGYASGSTSGFSYCSSSTQVVGKDNLCHTSCYAPDYYCNTGYSCYSNGCG